MRSKWLIIFLGYLGLAIIMTWPLLANLTNHIMGAGGDAPIFLWNAWWVKKAIFEGQNLFITDYIFYPQTVSLVFHTLTLFNSFIIALVSTVLSLIISFNIYFLVSVALSGFSMFMLVDYLTVRDGNNSINWAAFISGIIFAFAPYITMHWLGHQNLVTVWFLPLFILWLIRTVKDKQWVWPILAGVMAGIASLNDFYNSIFIFIFFVVFIFWLLIIKKINKQILTRLVVLVLIWLAIWSIWLIPALRIILSGQAISEVMSPEAITAFYSADLLRYVTPSFLNPIFGWMASLIPGRFSGGVEGTIFLGYTPIIIAVAFLIYRWKRKIVVNVFPSIGFWIATISIFGLLSLGPYLKIAERIIHIPLPYLWMYNLSSYWGHFRVPARFSLMIMLGLAVLVGIAINMFLKNNYQRQKLWIILICFLVILEFIPAPYPIMDLTVPPAYDLIEKDTNSTSVMDVPWGVNSGFGNKGQFQPEFIYYGTYHNKKITTGSISRIPDSYFDYYSNDQLPILTTDTVVIHKNYLLKQNIHEYMSYLQKAGFAKVFEDKTEVIYGK